MKPVHDLVGVNLPHVYTSWDVFGFGGRATIGRDAVICDDTGGYELICVADRLLEEGANVTLVTRFDRFPARVDGSTQWVDMTALQARQRLLPNEKFNVHRDSYLVDITAEDVGVRLIHPTAKTTHRVKADTVIMIGYNEPNRELADFLAGNGVPVYVVGDASGTRTLKTAIHSGNAIAQRLIAEGVKTAVSV
jgi:hypothetical protein